MNKISAKCEMLIRAPRSRVFAAFWRKDMLCKFWLKDASADLGPGARVEWRFMVPGVEETVDVLAFEQDQLIEFKWSRGNVVSLTFSSHSSGGSVVSVKVSGFSDQDPAGQAVGATEGFAIVLCDLKTLLETGASGGMVRDAALLIAEGEADA
jgi:uncharacterized protein YndB with AHSA1/START domain